MYRTPFPARLARRLVLDVREDAAAPAFTVLADLAARDPELVAELAVELARLVDDEVAARIVLDVARGDVPHTVAREAHRLHWHGLRSPWVVWGERLYFALRQRQRRKRVA